ncbi:hypothetical protein [Roseiflexus sp.]|uniref:hypothetical protein n=1 Tax=Roseiflexus sp. TaxID=2562120 RepID=UPI0021DD6BB2|nr:hypothetical protein [Roseiflexus sp.]GIV98807.1 MAG: hypothetical protein KatS3mg058_0211 [Roseiflexus sp.]
MRKKTSKIFKPMTHEQLRKNDIVLLVVCIVGLFFLGRDFYLSASKDIPHLGWLGYVTGPIFAHKISEILLLGLWLPIVWMSNYENSGLYPNSMPPAKYYRLLRYQLLIAPIQIILATYAWTIVNLGTSSLTTDYSPLIFREDGWVWRYYLAIVIVAGAVFIPFASNKAIHLAIAMSNGVTPEPLPIESRDE